MQPALLNAAPATAATMRSRPAFLPQPQKAASSRLKSERPLVRPPHSPIGHDVQEGDGALILIRPRHLIAWCVHTPQNAVCCWHTHTEELRMLGATLTKPLLQQQQQQQRAARSTALRPRWQLALAFALAAAALTALWLAPAAAPASRTSLDAPAAFDDDTTARQLHAAARAEQARFCAERHPLDLPNAREVYLDVTPAWPPLLHTTSSGGDDVAQPAAVKLTVYGQDDMVSGSLLGGDWEPLVAAQLRAALLRSSGRDGDSPTAATAEPPLFIDVGANVGAHALAMAAAGFRVWAFEGLPSNVELLRTSLCENPGALAQRVTLFPVGLGAADGECDVFVDARNRGDGVLRCRPVGSAIVAAPLWRRWWPLAGDGAATADDVIVPPSRNHVRAGRMRLAPLDRFLGASEHHIVAAMKVDVEGAEPLVLAGAANALERRAVRALALEFDAALLRGAGSEPLELARQLLGAGYRCSVFGIDDDGPWLDWEEFEVLAAGGTLAGVDVGAADVDGTNGGGGGTNLFCELLPELERFGGGDTGAVT